MKKKFIILTLCFTLIFTSMNYKKAYADGGIISLPILATVASLAVATGIALQGADDIYDIGAIFYNKYQNRWAEVQAIFAASVALNKATNKVSVSGGFLDIVKEFFNDCFYSYNSLPDINAISIANGIPVHDIDFIQNNYQNKNLSFGTSFDIGIEPGTVVESSNFTTKFSYYSGGKYTYIIDIPSLGLSSDITFNHRINYSGLFYGYSSALKVYYLFMQFGYLNNSQQRYSYSQSYISRDPVESVISIPYGGTYDPGILDKDDVGIYVPGNLGDLVGGTVKPGDITGDLTPDWVGNGDITIPNVENPSIDVDKEATFPSTGTVDPPDVIPPTGDVFPPWGGGIDFSPVTQSSFTDKFPFSLAKDMSNLFSIFDVEPKAPIFTVPIVGEELEIDLTQFSLWASIIRLFVLLGYVVGMINLTRKVIG